MYCFFDTETVGLSGPAVIIQYYCIDEDKLKSNITNEDIIKETKIHNFWTETVGDSLNLINNLLTYNLIGFNITFDMFQLQKIFSMLHIAMTKYHKVNDKPINFIDLMADIELESRDLDLCIKPVGCFDLMLHSQKTEFQITMERKPLIIRRVPKCANKDLIDIINEKLNKSLPAILFAKHDNTNLAKRELHLTYDDWIIQETKQQNIVNCKLNFKPSKALKALAQYALRIEDVTTFHTVELTDWPLEFQWAPFVKLFTNKNDNWWIKVRLGRKTYEGYGWPYYIFGHSYHWNNNISARTYATNDIVYTTLLYKYFNYPEINDTDSMLAVMCGTARHRGFPVNIDGIIKLREELVNTIKDVPTAPRQVRAWLNEKLDPLEQKLIKDSTAKILLKTISEWEDHPAQERAKLILEARQASKTLELYSKLLFTGRLHPSVKIIGALSGRMSGDGKMNVQGIKKTKQVRGNFFNPLFDEKNYNNKKLMGGDFDAFEVCIAEAAFNDPKLRQELLTMRPCHKCKLNPDKINNCKECKGTGKTDTKIHALFGEDVYPPLTYEEILATQGTQDDKYTKAKSGFFALIYGGEGYTLMSRLGVDIEVANLAYKKFCDRFPGVNKTRNNIFSKFCSMRQPDGIGTKVEWHEPDNKISSLLGFNRYFIVENVTCKLLFDLSQSLMYNSQLAKYKNIRITRYDKEQSVIGALQSCLYGSAFNIQSNNKRAAANHVIQSTGAQITKEVQLELYNLQPTGIKPFVTQSINIHDEIMCLVHDNYCKDVKNAVDNKVSSYKSLIPLIKMEWKEINTWADK